jgi:hypothetical protein
VFARDREPPSNLTTELPKDFNRESSRENVDRPAQDWIEKEEGLEAQLANFIRRNRSHGRVDRCCSICRGSKRFVSFGESCRDSFLVYPL